MKHEKFGVPGQGWPPADNSQKAGIRSTGQETELFF